MCLCFVGLYRQSQCHSITLPPGQLRCEEQPSEAAVNIFWNLTLKTVTNFTTVVKFLHFEVQSLWCFRAFAILWQQQSKEIIK